MGAEAGGHTRWSWADSSPQAKRDWFQSKQLIARNDRLVALAEAVDVLVAAEDAGRELPLSEVQETPGN